MLTLFKNAVVNVLPLVGGTIVVYATYRAVDWAFKKVSN